MSSLASALKKAQKQGLISLRGMERELGVSRNTARTALRGTRTPLPETQERLWAYLREKGVG